MIVTEIEEYGGGFARICPRCGEQLAYSPEYDMMPEYNTCTCNMDKFDTYLDADNVLHIVHNDVPRFVGTVAEGCIKNIIWVDKEPDNSIDVLKEAALILQKYDENISNYLEE